MSKTERRLRLAGKEIILVGTAHISEASIAEVSDAIRTEKPDCVAVELDNERLAAMKNPDAWKNLDIIKVLKEKRGLVLMANLTLSSFQKRLGSGVGVQPGEELRAAIDVAEELGITAVVVDRPIQVTLRRAWGKNTLWGKCKLLATLLGTAFSTDQVSVEDIEKLKNSSEMDSMMDELAASLPVVKTVLIDERDRYLASRIWQCAERSQASGGKVLAVLGAGHLPGVVSHLERLASGDESGDTGELEVIPGTPVSAKLAGFLFPAALVALIVAGFFIGEPTTGVEMLVRWVLWNGSLAAAGTLIAGGHILAALAGFVCAPIATLNPFIGVGLFTGIVQAWLKKPKVADMETLSDDVASLRGIYRNRILRVLLIFFVSSLGAAIGNLISVPALLSLIGVHS
jgi:pheromone shutdown-related protein TraB